VLEPALHVLTEPDHLVACFAIGLLAGQRASRREAALLLAGFWVAFCAGALTRIASFEAIDAYASAASLIAAGLVVALPRIAVPLLAMLVALATGTVHGLANALPAALAAALVAAAGWALAAAFLRAPWGAIAVRVLGSWAAALGLILLGIALR